MNSDCLTTYSIAQEKFQNNYREKEFNNDGKNFDNVHQIDSINNEINKIGREILRLTLIVKQRNVKDINKNFQATLTNYFLECYACALLRKHMGLQYKRDVKKKIESMLKNNTNTQTDTNYSQTTQDNTSIEQLHIQQQNIFQNSKEKQKQQDNKKIAKYVRLIKVYEEQISAFKLEEQYINMLIEKINEDANCFSKDSQKYVTQYQKKLCALLVLQHFLQGKCGIVFKSFCELWNSVFLNLPLYYFARENNIFYNQVKIGEEIELENQSDQLGQFNFNNKCNDEHFTVNDLNNQLKKPISKKKKNLNNIDCIVASYRKISQKHPNTSYDYTQMFQLFQEKEKSIPSQLRQKYLECQNQQLKLEQNNNDLTYSDKPNEIHVVNLFTIQNTLQSKDKWQKNNKDQLTSQSLFTTKSKKLNKAERKLQIQINKQDDIENENRLFQFNEQSQTQTTKIQNLSQTPSIQQNSNSSFQEQKSMKQAKYRLI